MRPNGIAAWVLASSDSRQGSCKQSPCVCLHGWIGIGIGIGIGI
jgi:hypothetical protein